MGRTVWTCSSYRVGGHMSRSLNGVYSERVEWPETPHPALRGEPGPGRSHL